MSTFVHLGAPAGLKRTLLLLMTRVIHPSISLIWGNVSGWTSLEVAADPNVSAWPCASKHCKRFCII